jgi:hypothetical protein
VPAILGGALALQVGLMAHLGDRAYGDVLKSVNFGRLVASGAYDLRRDVVNSKTFVGPAITYWLFARGGLAGLHAANLIAFVLLGAVLLRLGHRQFDAHTRLLALFLFAFYVGTQRSIVAGELEDQLATLLLATGILLYLERGTVFTASLVVGLGFLFKFWVAIFGVGFVAHLLVTDRRQLVPGALLGLGLPLAALATADGGASLRSLLLSVGKQVHYSTWSEAAVKSVSTGLVPCFGVAVAAWAERRRPPDTLSLLLFASYLLYTVAMRDVHAASTMMMTCLVFASPLIAAWLVGRARRLGGTTRRAAVVGLVLLYPVATTFVTRLHLHRDTHPLRLVETSAEAARMFRYNAPPADVR